ncbi:histidine--tRNA ligase family protein, partial [bacterium]|nr:histidine--tRNA ligase family protein [bacterium]
ADRPQPRQGRFREFVQCDADIVGTDSLLADAEIIALTYEVLRDLGFENFKIRLSSRKFLLDLVMWATHDESYFIPFCRAFDKLDKIGWDGVAEELLQHGFHLREHPEFEVIKQHLAQADFTAVAYALGKTDTVRHSLNEIREVYHHAVRLGVPEQSIVCDPFLARGLDYYTGPIFETVLPDHPHIGSLSGGGRYDGLVSTFSKQSVPATGTTIGLDRIQTALTEIGKFQPLASTTQVLIARFDAEGVPFALELAAELRKAGVRVEVWYDDDKLKKQFAYANMQEIPLVIVAGPDERARGTVAVKNMRTGEQQEFARTEAVPKIAALLRSL